MWQKLKLSDQQARELDTVIGLKYGTPCDSEEYWENLPDAVITAVLEEIKASNRPSMGHLNTAECRRDYVVALWILGRHRDQLLLTLRAALRAWLAFHSV